MKRDFVWFVVILLVFLFGIREFDRYQATSLNGQAFVLDKHTGEVWVSIKNRGGYMNLAEMEMVPVQYSSYQYNWGFNGWMPEYTRNKERGWGALVMRKLFPPKKPIVNAADEDGSYVDVSDEDVDEFFRYAKEQNESK